MRVSGQEYLRLSHLRQVNRVTETPSVASIATAPARNGGASQLDISAEAMDVQRVIGMVAKQPEIREDIVASLRERIEKGTYAVSGKDIGEMMFRRLMADRIA